MEYTIATPFIIASVVHNVENIAGRKAIPPNTEERVMPRYIVNARSQEIAIPPIINRSIKKKSRLITSIPPNS